MRLYLIRHADPDYPNNTITPAGHLEAQALAIRMKKLGLDFIYASPLGRAVHTAQYTADALNLKPEIAPWTAELGPECALTFQDHGTLAAWDTPGELIRETAPYVHHENWHEHDLFKPNPCLKSTFTRIGQDSDAFLTRHGYERQGGRYKILNGGNRHKIALFCHGGFGLWFLAHLLELPLPLVWAGFHLPPSSVTTILFDERSKRWAVPRCTGVGDVSHLYAANLPTQPAGIKANID